jgi:hypothetical protein
MNMEDNNTNGKKTERGCGFILSILLISFAGMGVFFFLAGKFFGTENRHLIFFGCLGLIVMVMLGKELFKKN